MTFASRIVYFALWLLLSGSWVSATETETTAPARFARTLVMVQDQIVLGSTAALESVPEMRRRLAFAIDQAPASIWKDTQHVRALVLHLLNGGAPRVVRKLVDAKVDFGGWRDITLALLAHAEQRKDAAQQLGTIDARLLDPGIAGPFALAQAISSAAEPAKAKAFLAQAKLLSPGGLVEDAAMRREMELLISDGQKLEAAQAAARYLWRFGSSVYAKDVVAFLADSLIPELAALPDGRGAVAMLAGELPIPARIETLMTVARRAMLGGSMQAADFAANQVLDLAHPDSAEKARAALYTGIARAFSDPTGTSIEKLREREMRDLSGEERNLLRASLLALNRVRAPIDANATVAVSSSAAVEAAAHALRAAQGELDQKRP